MLIDKFFHNKNNILYYFLKQKSCFFSVSNINSLFLMLIAEMQGFFIRINQKLENHFYFYILFLI